MIEKCNKEMRKRNSGKKPLALGRGWGGASPVARIDGEGPVRLHDTETLLCLLIAPALPARLGCLIGMLQRVQAIGPLLEHLAALGSVFCPVVDSAHPAQLMVQCLLNPIRVVSHLA